MWGVRVVGHDHVSQGTKVCMRIVILRGQMGESREPCSKKKQVKKLHALNLARSRLGGR